jgi:hypothetical protein
VTKPNSTVDWERIEADYRAGILSLREIAANTAGANHVAIARRAKKEGWTRDLSARIQAKADELVTKQAVTAEETEKRAVTDRTIVEVNAQAVANVRLSHRNDIAKSRHLAMTLLRELELQTDNIDILETLADLVTDIGEDATKGQRDVHEKRLEAFSKIISSASRIDSMKKLADTLRTLVLVEREAWGIQNSNEGETPQTITKLVREIVRPS